MKQQELQRYKKKRRSSNQDFCESLSEFFNDFRNHLVFLKQENQDPDTHSDFTQTKIQKVQPRINFKDVETAASVNKTNSTKTRSQN